MKAFKVLFKKNKFSIKLIVIFGVLFSIFYTSCKKENFTPENQQEGNITENIQKIENSFKAGNVKVETMYVDGCDKVEYEASETIKSEIQKKLAQSYTKTAVLKNGGHRVGVFKSGSCGSYATLVVYMDSEDKNCASNHSGWHGESGLRDQGNISLSFCVVDATYFGKTGADYALLNLSSSNSWGVANGIMRYIDNEDDKNRNQTLFNGANISGWMGTSWFGNNTRLQFYYYKQYGSVRNFPNLGISYGTLGRYGSYQGSIYSDDEDKNNANSAYYYDNYYSDAIVTGNIPNIMDVGRNTRFYISKAW
jgi:hypothetical protein